MKLSVERMPESRVALDIAAEEAEYTQAVDRAYRRVAKEIVLPGFRKGKAPRPMIERVYGRDLFVEEANKDLMDRLYRDALKEADVVPVGEPEVELTEAEPIAFRVVIPVYPTVDPGAYAEVRVEPRDAAVEEGAAEQVLERLRTGQATWVEPAEPRAPREGDQVTLDLEVREEGEPFQEPAQDADFVLGESNLFEPLEERIKELAVGETTTLELAFDDTDESVSPNIRGKALAYTVTLKGLKERDLPALDDDLAKALADRVGTDAETLDDLRREIGESLHREKTTETRTEVVNEIVAKMAEGSTIELPSVMVDEAVDEEIQSLRQRLMQAGRSLEDYLRGRSQTEADLRAEQREGAAHRLRNSLVLREIAKREGVEVTDDDLAAEVEDLARGAADPARAREIYGGDYFRNILRSDLFERRVTDRLIAIATEGRGAVANGWVEPERPAASEGGEDGQGGEDEAAQVASGTAAGTEEPAGAAVGEAAASESEDTAPVDAPTTGAMPGQPGGIAATATAADPDAAVAVAAVAAEPDPAQAAAVGHEAENAAVAAIAPEGAVTPEAREEQG